MSYLLSQLINGITLGGLYALVALGYTLVYGILLMINFAHSELFMAGGYVGLGVLKLLSDTDVAKGPLAFMKPVQAFFNHGTLGFAALMAATFLISAVVVGIL
ncbi:MAG TPA: hypothetical protein VIK83_03535, partial [Coriobacteriia bacterium]